MSRFARDGLQTLALSGISRVLGIGVGIVLARSLGPAGKGTIAYAAIALELFVVAIGGVAQAVAYQIGRSGRAPGDVYAAMVRIVAGIAAVATIAVAGVAIAVPSQHALLWAALAIPFATYGEATLGMLLAAQQVAATNVQRAFSTIVFNAAAIAALVFFHAGAATVLLLWVLGYVAGALYSARAVRPFVRERRGDAGLVREQTHFAAKASSAGIAGYINMRIDVVVVSALLGPRALGNYTLAVTMAEVLWQLSQPFCWAAMGRIAAAPLDEAAAFTAKVMRHVIALVVPLGVLAFFLAPILVTAVYGAAFAPAAGALRWILPGVVAYAIEIPLGYFLMVKLGRPLTIVVIQTASIVICAGLAGATVRRWGIDAAAMATSVTYIGVVVAKSIVFARSTGLPARAMTILRRSDLALLLSSRRIVSMRTRARTLLPSGFR